MKRQSGFLILLLASTATAQNLCPPSSPCATWVNGHRVVLPSAATSRSPQQVGSQLEHSVPLNDAVMFVPPAVGQEGWLFARSPDGSTGVIPVSKIKEAFSAGYKPVTIGEVLDSFSADAKLVQSLQSKLADLTSDYDALVARYNRLAAVNATPLVQPQPTSDNRELMRSMLLRSLFQRPPAPIQVDVRTIDCTRFPAVCVGH
jgi:hypothetical protein